jgi:putative redox protein
MKVKLTRVSGAQFEATNDSGQRTVLDGPPDVGGVGAGLRPMELLLTSLAGCSAVDILHIMQKQRQALEDLDIEVSGTRADAVPAVFTAIHLKVTASGPIDDDRLQRAVELSMEKYCSVAKMLEPTVRITFEAKVRAPS